MLDLYAQCDELELKTYPYIQLTAPALFPITSDEVRGQLKIDWTPDVLLAAWITTNINAAVKAAEDYMNRPLLSRSIRTYRDYFESFIELRKFPVTAITKFQYTNVSGNVISMPITFPNDYYYLTEEIYPQLRPYSYFPNDEQERKQVIMIEFNAGYTSVANLLIPMPDIKGALLSHIAFMYANRGDSDNAASSISGGSDSMSSTAAIPNQAKEVYDRYRIKDISSISYSPRSGLLY